MGGRGLSAHCAGFLISIGSACGGWREKVRRARRGGRDGRGVIQGGGEDRGRGPMNALRWGAGRLHAGGEGGRPGRRRVRGRARVQQPRNPDSGLKSRRAGGRASSATPPPAATPSAACARPPRTSGRPAVVSADGAGDECATTLTRRQAFPNPDPRGSGSRISWLVI